MQKDIVNFLANSPEVPVFIKSTDVSEVMKNANFLFEVLNEMVVGKENVVQVVIDNASNYIEAGRKLRIRFSSLS